MTGLTFWHKIRSDLRKQIILLLGSLILINILLWLGVFIYAKQYPFLLGLASLAYGFGLRHAVDADHIAAIDNTVRKLMQDGQKPIGVGLFFSLGHSTIVILLSLGVAISAGYISTNLPQFKEIGSLIGTSVSAIFLLVIGIINLLVFIDIFKTWRHVTTHGKFSEEHIDEHLHNRGLIARILKPLLKTIKYSWQMYFVGFLFGLGFDTASEVGLLSISAASGSQGVPFMGIFLLPLIFTAGMALVDTLDSILMLGAYGWAQIHPVRKLYYNLNITFISVVIALFIGSLEALQILSERLGYKHGIFALANSIELENVGYIIIVAFIISWLFSYIIYKVRKYDQLEIHTHAK